MSGIRATRDEVSDRFPVLGFVIQTGGNPYFEVVLTTQPGQPRDQRTSASFYSTRPQGPLAAERGEAVFLVPPDVLRRFAGASRLYYGVATFADAGRNHPEVLRVPGQNSPYVSLRSFSGRPSRRIQVTPISRRTTGNRYSSPAPEELIWAGDQPQPGSEPLTPPAANGGPGISRPAPGAGETGSPTVNGTPAEAPPTGQGQALDYDDGFGPMPADEGGTAENEGIDYPIDDSLTPAVAAGLGRARALTQAPEYPAADSFVAAKYFQRRSQPRTVNRLVIHITDGSNARAIGTANYFHGDPLGDLAINRVNGELEVEQEGGRMVRFRSGRTWHDSYDGIIHTRNGRSFGRVLRRVSAHYVVGQAGEVVQCVRNNDVAWHASSANGDSIGIEHCASLQFHNPPTQVQYEASAALVCWLCDQLGIPKDREHILGHSEADPGTSHSGCPNTVWDWELYMQLVTSGSCVAAGPGVAEPVAAAATLTTPPSRPPGRIRPAAPRRGAIVRPLVYNVITPLYTPDDPEAALRLLNEFQQRRDRWRAGVADTSFFPHSAICRFRIRKPDGEYIGTGFYIGADRILTCAHNVDGATSITVVPGLNDQQNPAEPFGSFTVQPSDWRKHPQYNSASRDFDLAVLRVNTPPPAGAAFYVLEELTQCIQESIIVCGYAAESVSANRQHLDGDTIRTLSDSGECFQYNLQTEGGSSGSPVFYVTSYDDEVRQVCVMETIIVGVHTSIAVDSTTGHLSNSLNEGCRLTAAKIDWIHHAFDPAAGAAALGQSRSRSLPPEPRSNGKPLARGAAAPPAARRDKPQTPARPQTSETDLAPDPLEEEGYEEESAAITTAQTSTECSDSFCPVSPAGTAGTANFSLAEFQCRDGTPVPERFRGNTQQVMENLEVFRAETGGQPITILSGYRTCAYNSTLEGAASHSRHLCGQAADIRVTDLTPVQVRDRIETLIADGRMRQGGLGLYDTFVHYDVRGSRARWDKRRTKAAALGDPGEVTPDYSQANSTVDALTMFFDWLRRSLTFRVGVHTTAFFPHSAIAKLRLLDSNGELLGEGSGFYVGRNKLVTAGHCLVNDDGSRVQGVEVIPGMQGADEPFGGGAVSLAGLHPHSQYNPLAYDASFDVGVITDAPDAPGGNWFEMEELRMSPNTGIITCGYAAVGVDPRVQHLDVDTIRELHDGTFTYAAQVRQGSSGGPVFYALDAGTIRVVGLNVTTYDDHQNRGLRLTDPLIRWIDGV